MCIVPNAYMTQMCMRANKITGLIKITFSFLFSQSNVGYSTHSTVVVFFCICSLVVLFICLIVFQFGFVRFDFSFSNFILYFGAFNHVKCFSKLVCFGKIKNYLLKIIIYSLMSSK